MNVEAVVWEVCNGTVVCVKIDDDLFYNNGFQRVGRVSNIEHWISENDIHEFTMEDFFKDFPNAKHHRKDNEKHIARLISKKRLQQMGNEKFKVLK